MKPERYNKLLSVIRKRQPDLTVVLENVYDPHNISAVMRTCDAVAIQHVYTIDTRPTRHEKWGFRSSSSASKWMTIHPYDDLDRCYEDLRRQYERILVTHLDDEATDLYGVDFTGPVALVFGNEHAGVSEEARSKADGSFFIPQQGMIRSLNISVACAVTLYEAYRQKSAAGHYHRDFGEHPMQEELFRQWNMRLDAETPPGVGGDQH